MAEWSAERHRREVLARIEKTPTGCWLWTGVTGSDGYGRRKFKGAKPVVHRVAYELFIGPIPPGMQIDHVCHNNSGCALNRECPHRRCINPDHLEAVTGRENSLRTPNTLNAINAAKTHCRRGHAYTPANTGSYGPSRVCRACHRESQARYLARRAAS